MKEVKSSVVAVCRKDLTQQAEDCLLRKAWWQSWPMAGVRKIGFLRVSHVARKCSCKQCGLYNCFLPSRSLEFWYMAGRRLLCNTLQIKTLSTESLKSFPGRQHFAHVPNCCWRNWENPVWLQWERTLRSLCLVSSVHCPKGLLPLLILLWVLS